MNFIFAEKRYPRLPFTSSAGRNNFFPAGNPSIREVTKAGARENPARALRSAEIGCTFSLGRKFKTEIPGEHAAD
jgi:hypothetical protein